MTHGAATAKQPYRVPLTHLLKGLVTCFCSLLHIIYKKYNQFLEMISTVALVSCWHSWENGMLLYRCECLTMIRQFCCWILKNICWFFSACKIRGSIHFIGSKIQQMNELTLSLCIQVATGRTGLYNGLSHHAKNWTDIFHKALFTQTL